MLSYTFWPSRQGLLPMNICVGASNSFWTSPMKDRVTPGRLPKEAPSSADLAKTYALEAGE